MFSLKNGKSRAAMNGMVVLSLYTDGQGPRKEEFALLRDRLTGTASNPVYAVVDPFEKDKVLYKTDFNTAKDDALFGEKLAKAARRFKRAAKSHLTAVTNKK